MLLLVPHEKPYKIYCIIRNVSSRIYGTLCGPLEIPGGPQVVHLDQVEDH